MLKLVRRILGNIVYVGKCLLCADKKKIKHNGKTAYLFGVAEHNNIGDLMINIAETDFIHEIMPKYDVVRISDAETPFTLRSISQKLQKDDVIILHGGGNMGSLYPAAERSRRAVLNYFKNYEQKKIIFPQSIFYEDNLVGKMELFLTRRLLMNSKNTFLFIREDTSLERATNNFPGIKPLLVPDIVMSKIPNDQSINKLNSLSSVLVLFRNDDEAGVSGKEKQNIILFLKSRFKSVVVSDMISKKSSGVYEKQKQIVNAKLKQIESADLIITDRLHGMIFSLISRKNVLVLDNNNSKVKSSYQKWLSEFPNVQLLDNGTVDELSRKIQCFNSSKGYQKGGVSRADFNPLIDCLKS